MKSRYIRRASSTSRQCAHKFWILSLMTSLDKTLGILAVSECMLDVKGCESLGPVEHCEGLLQ